MKNTFFALPTNAPNIYFLWVICALILLAGGLAGATGQFFWLGLPAAGLVLWLAFVDFRKLFYLLMGCIPFSTEVELPGGFGTDLPTEPLMLGLLGIGFLFLIKNLRTLSGRFLKHPISIFILFHFAWIVLTTVLSENAGVSMKFMLAKIWYIGVFYFLAGHLLSNERAVREMIFWMLPGLIVTIGFCTIKHATMGFEFRHVNEAMLPFYRNKVMYSCLLAVIFPFLWMKARATPRHTSLFKWLVLTIVLCLIGIQLSYTRAAYIVILLAYFLYLILKKKKIRVALGGMALFFTILIGYLANNNNYLNFSPEFKKTVEHKKFGNLIEATYKLQDVSTMERVFRWVAGFRMVQAKPIFGFGPGNFTFFYEKYTVTSFTTYVSNNEERSGVHCYFLMVAIEQGIIGFLIFLIFSAFVLLFGEKIYHQTADPSGRRMLLMAWLSFAIIALLMLMNDLVETDKVGSFFWLCCAIMVNVDLANQAKKPG
jgi:O-antigen ligase